MSAENSTNVRPANAAPSPHPVAPAVAPAVVRAGVHALAAVSPRAAAAVMGSLFFRAPRRRPRSETERAVLARGAPFAIGTGRERLAAWRWGEGPPVLLLHGWGGCAGQMTPLVDPLLAAGFQVVALDAPAHGDSPGRRASIPLFAKAIARAAEAVGPLRGVVAHSMGGAAFSLAAARGLGAGRAVFVGPPSDAALWYRGFVRWLDYPQAAEPALLARVEAIAGEGLGRLNARALGPEMKVPLLVVHDRQDREVALEEGAEVARAAGGRILVTEGLGHRRILRDPGVAAAAVRFLLDGTVEAARTAA